MLDQRQIQCANIETALGEWPVFAGYHIQEKLQKGELYHIQENLQKRELYHI